ncbi:MAG TPA: very short patch repair endonuclease [Opitutaceae bacterium]|nr:very short patch repair endonuclease [Opitutaceae bacterium]
MPDKFSSGTRSRIMAAIRGKNTTPELTVRRFLHAKGLRFRLHAPGLPGRPDLVFPKYRTVVFVHGCFWHQHQNCRFARMPASNQRFWTAKLSGNRLRDRRKAQALRTAGWRVLTIWECQLNERRLQGLAARIAD